MNRKKASDISEANQAIARGGDGRQNPASGLTTAKEQNAAIAQTGIAQIGERGEDGSETEDALKRAAERKRRTG